MGEDDVVDNDYCSHQATRRDCDGDYDTYCHFSGDCEYKRNVRDCDGDIISMCRK